MSSLKCRHFELKGGTICWRVHRNDPLMFSPSFAGLQILNPLAFFFQRRQHPEQERTDIRPPIIIGDAVVLWTDRIWLLADGTATIPTGAELLEDLVPSIIAALRAVSMQKGLRLYPDAGGGSSIGKLDVFFPSAGERRSRVSKSEYETAVTLDVARKAAQQYATAEFDIHQVVLLDAVEAWIYCDYRTSILYSASAVEIAATRIIDEAASAGNGIEDPVLRALPDRFANLLHERLLYVSNKSLRRDSPDDYKNALKLYKTRNALIHRGLPRGSDDLPLTSQGAKTAIATAKSVIEWLGFQVQLDTHSGMLEGHEVVDYS